MSAGSGVVSVRFDVQGNEQLIAALKTIATSSKGLTTTFTEMQGKLAAPMGGLGPLQGLAAGVGAAETKVTSFRGSLASIGSQLGQNATSFGVATASIWGVYNAYDSLTKVQIRANSAAVRVSTLETTLASLTERRRIAVEKGNLTGEQLAVLNERIANTQEKLSVAQERSADVAQDVQEAWAGFASQVGPQIVAAGGSIAQLFTTLTQKGPEGVNAITKLKTSFVSLFTSLGGAGASGLGAIPAMFTRMKTAITGTTPAISPLDNAMRGAGASTGFLSSSIGVFAVSAGIGAVAAAAFAFGVMEMQKNMEAAGLKMQTMKFGLLDVKNAQISFDQMDAIIKKFAEHGQTVSVAWINMFPAEALAKFKEFGGKINETTGQIEPLATALSELGAGFTATREEYIGWATGLIQQGQKAGQIFDWLKKSKISDADATQIQIAANTAYNEKLAALGISTERYNEIGAKAKDIIGIYIDRVKSGNVPLDALTGSIHGQVQAWQESTGATEDEAKVMEKLIIESLKVYGTYKNTAVAIDQARIKRLQEVSAIKASAAAYLGLDAIQNQSVGSLQNFNEITGKSIDALVEKGLTLRKTADAENLANQTTFDAVTANADYIEKMINVNKVNDGSITSYIALRNAIIAGKEAAEDFVTQTVLGKEQTDAYNNALLEEIQVFTKVPNVLHLTTEELNKIYQAEVQTGEGGKELAKIFAEDVLPGITDVFDQISKIAEGDKVKKSLKDLFKEFDVKHFFKGERGNLEDALVEQFHVDRFADQMNAKLKGVELLITAAKMDDKDATIVANGLMKMINDRIAKQPELAAHIKPVQDLIQQVINSDHPLQTLIANFAAIKAGLDESKTPLDDIDKLIAGLPGHADSAASSVNGLAVSLDTVAANAKRILDQDWNKFGKFAQSGVITSPDAGYVSPTQAGSTPSTDVKPPKPVVFPPPDLSNILAGVSKAEIMMSEMVKYAAGLTIAFPEPKTNAIITGVSKAQIVSGDLVTYVAGLPLAFPGINIVGIANSTSSASKAAATLVPDIAGLKPMFPGVNIVGVVNSTSSAKKAAATLVPDIKALKPAFPGVNIIGVVNSTTNAKNAASKLEGHVAGLNLKFPSINISNISSSVNSAQNKIDSLHGKNIVNHVSTVFDNAGGNILNDAMITSAANGKLFTTNGEQLFRVGDNPGGRETIAIIPHDKPHEIMDRLSKMFPPINSLLHERARKPSMQTISGHSMGGRTSAGSTMVNVTTQVYLFPGSEMFKKYVRQIMVEDLGRQMTA